MSRCQKKVMLINRSCASSTLQWGNFTPWKKNGKFIQFPFFSRTSPTRNSKRFSVFPIFIVLPKKKEKKTSRFSPILPLAYARQMCSSSFLHLRDGEKENENVLKEKVYIFFLRRLGFNCFARK